MRSLSVGGKLAKDDKNDNHNSYPDRDLCSRAQIIPLHLLRVGIRDLCRCVRSVARYYKAPLLDLGDVAFELCAIVQRDLHSRILTGTDLLDTGPDLLCPLRVFL